MKTIIKFLGALFALLILAVALIIAADSLGLFNANYGGESPNRQLVIKGLHLGMDIHELPDWLDKHLSGTNLEYRIFDTSDKDGLQFVVIAHANNMKLARNNTDSDTKVDGYSPGRSLIAKLNAYGAAPSGIVADSNGKIIEFSFQGYLVEYLFNAKEMKMTEFIDTFNRSYNVDLKQDGFMGPWTYQSPEEYTLEISSDLTLLLKSVAKRSEVEKSFD